MLTRRELLKLGLASGAGLLLPAGTFGSAAAQMGPGGGGGMGGGGTGGRGMGGGGGMEGMTSSPATTPFQVPLPIPKPLSPTPMVDEMGMPYDFYQVTVRASQQQFIPGLTTPIIGYNGTFPGPAIKARSGRPVTLRVVNELGENIVNHLHGGHIPVEQDGHAMDYIFPGTQRDYLYPNNQIASTIWFHDHTMDHTGRHVYMGMAGLYIIEDDYELSLPLPKGAQDVPLVIQDRLFNADGSFNYTLNNMDLMHGKQGDVILVNGAVQPYLKVSTRKYRFRILNGSNGRFYRLVLSNGKPFVQVGSDGGLLAAPVTRSYLDIASGERVEVVIDFAGYKTGTQIVLRNSLGSGRTADVMRFDVSTKEADNASVPSSFRPIERIPESKSMRTRTFTLGMNMMATGSQMFTINGLAYDHMRVDADPGLGMTEVWEFVNPMGMAHPMHAHDIMWQILDRNGSPPPAWEMGWKNTWVVPANGRVRVIGTFTDYACNVPMVHDPMMDPSMHMDLEYYMLHCHILEHEDHGMMAQFKVLDTMKPM